MAFMDTRRVIARRPGQRCRVAALFRLMLSVATVISLTSCATETAESRPEACASYAHVESTAHIGLAVSPSNGRAGDLVTVRRTDRQMMDFGPLFLYGDADAGCRMFSLTLDGSGPKWLEVTNESEFGTLSVTSPSAMSEDYELPDVAEHGSYLLCTADEEASSLCAHISI